METQTQITVYGTDWCGDTRQSLRQLDRLGVPYEYVNIDEDADGEKVVLAFNKGRRRVPTIELPSDNGTKMLSVPREAELERELREAGVLQ